MTDMDLLNSAWNSVSSSELPDEFKGLALRELLRARLGADGPIQGRPTPPSGTPRQPRTENGQEDATVDVDSAYATLASETGIDEDQIREVLLIEASGEIHVLPPGRQLGSNNTERTRNVVSLIVGARYGAFGDRTVNIEVIRSECQDKKCYDSGNFKSNHVGKHDGVSTRADDVYVNPSKWMAMFARSLETARGVGDA